MNTDLMMRHALLAGLTGSGKAMAASLLTQPEWTQPADIGDDSSAHRAVTAAQGTAACADREVTG